MFFAAYAGVGLLLAVPVFLAGEALYETIARMPYDFVVPGIYGVVMTTSILLAKRCGLDPYAPLFSRSTPES